MNVINQYRTNNSKYKELRENTANDDRTLIRRKSILRLSKNLWIIQSRGTPGTARRSNQD